MKKQNVFFPILSAAGILLLIFDAKTARSGMQEGIDICLRTLIPSLFPFFVLSGILTSALTGQPIPLLRPICRICHMGPGCESLFAAGILGGYPVGAANVAIAHRSGHLSAEEANRYSVFCNNAGPSFLFGILGPMFPGISWVMGLWMIQVAATIATGFVLKGTAGNRGLPRQNRISVGDAVNKAMRNMAGVCAWVVLFRLCLSFADRWLFCHLPEILQVLLAGILELSNGCLRLCRIADPKLRFAVASVMLSLGGVSILMQTKAVFPQLHLRRYIAGRFVHLFFSSVLSVAAVFLMRAEISIFGSAIILISVLLSLHLFGTGKFKKEVAIP